MREAGSVKGLGARWDFNGENWKMGMRSWETHLNGRHNALLLATQATALFPAHGLEHATANVVTAQPVPCGLLKVPAGDSGTALSDWPASPRPPTWPWALTRRLQTCHHTSSSWALVAQGCHTSLCVRLRGPGTSFAESLCVRWGRWSLLAGNMGTDECGVGGP